MELSTMMCLEIYKYLLTVEHGATYGTISLKELEYKAEVRKAHPDHYKPGSSQKQEMARRFDQLSQPARIVEAVFNYEGKIDTLMHVDIMRICSRVYQ
jgi:hypothetical protein